MGSDGVRSALRLQFNSDCLSSQSFQSGIGGARNSSGDRIGIIWMECDALHVAKFIPVSQHMHQRDSWLVALWSVIGVAVNRQKTAHPRSPFVTGLVRL